MHPTGEPGRAVDVDHVVDEHREPILAEAGDRIGGGDPPAQPPSDLAQDRVARRVAQADVDGLEAVDVDEEDGQAALTARQQREASLEPVEEYRAVRQPGQRIVEGDVKEPLFRPSLVRDVERDPDRARDGAPRVAQGLDVGGERAPTPLHLEVHRFAHERLAVGGDGQELGVVRREVFEDAAAGLLAGTQVEAFEARAQARGEAQVGVGGPDDRGHLLGEQAQVRLAPALLAPDAVGARAVARIVAGQGDGRLHTRTSLGFPWLRSSSPAPGAIRVWQGRRRGRPRDRALLRT